jgi:hypothetical protein
MGVSFGRSPAGNQVLFQRALIVLSSDMSHRGTDMSCDMNFLSFWDKRVGSGSSEYMAVGLSKAL